MSSFTIYCHGTNSHRSRTDGEIVAEFGKATISPHLILDGPGSKGETSDDKMRNPLPGFYNPFSKPGEKVLKSDKTARDAELMKLMRQAEEMAKDNVKRPYSQAQRLPGGSPQTSVTRSVSQLMLTRREIILKEQGLDIGTEKGRKQYAERALSNLGFAETAPSYSKKLFAPLPKRFELTAQGKGLTTGWGWDDNIAEAIAVLFDHLDTHGPITDLNLMGWSRGAVTCLRIANRLHEMAKSGSLPFAISIFAIDPVAGNDAGKLLDDACRVPSSVENYIATLAMDEQRGAFSPQDLSRVTTREGMNVVFLPFPGKHNTQVRIDGSGDTRGVAEIVWSLAYKFLAACDTKFDRLPPAAGLGSWEYLRKYSDIRLHRQDYHKLRNRGLGARVQGGIGPRAFTGMDNSPHQLKLPALEEYVINSEYFVNLHHRYLFEKLHPAVFDWAFSPSPKFGKSGFVKRGTTLGDSIEALSRDGREVYESLCTEIVKFSGGRDGCLDRYTSRWSVNAEIGEIGWYLPERRNIQPPPTIDLMSSAMERMGVVI